MKKKIKMLCMDDDTQLLKMLSLYFERLNYIVLTAEDGKEGLKIFKAQKPDIVLVDLMMPHVNGFEVLETITRQAPEIPILVVSGEGEMADVIQALRLGAWNYQTKPVKNMAALKYAVEQAIEKAMLLTANKAYQMELEQKNTVLRYNYSLAQQVFSKITPVNILKEKKIRHFSTSVEAVGGDFTLYTQSPQGNEYVFLGDFTGHGLAASLGVVPVYDILENMGALNKSLADIILAINKKLKFILPVELSLSAGMIVWNNEEKQIHVYNSGLPDIVMVGNAGGIKKYISSMTVPLGILNNGQLEVQPEIINVSENDRIYLYTDGLIEAINKKGEFFGQERLNKHFDSYLENKPRFDSIIDDLAEFQGGTVQQDDISLLEIKPGRYD